MSEKIEGHIQWNGKRWQFTLNANPKARCEFEDHRSCIAKTAEYVANLDAEAKAKLDAQVEENKVKVEEQAKENAEQAEKDAIAEAGRRKHEATRQNGLTTQAALDAAKDKAAKRISEAQAVHDAAVRAANADLDAETKEAIEAQIAEQKVINGTDWLGIVKGERDAKILADKLAQEAEQARIAKEKADAEAAEAARLAEEKAKADAEAARLAEEKAKADAEAARLAQEKADAEAEVANVPEVSEAPSTPQASPTLAEGEQAPPAPVAESSTPISEE